MLDAPVIDTPTQLHVARAIAHVAHRGQVDKAGEPYINHPAAVAASFRGGAGVLPYQIVAWLHDVLEDSDLTSDDLRRAGISPGLVQAIERLTHQKNEPLVNYYQTVMENEISHRVKLADVRHNSDPRRLSRLDEQTQLRLLAKYANALSILEGTND